MEANVQNKLISVIMAICLLCSMYYLARTAVIYTMQQEKEVSSRSLCWMRGMGVVDSASNKNIKNTKRKATAVPIKTEYM